MSQTELEPNDVSRILENIITAINQRSAIRNLSVSVAKNGNSLKIKISGETEAYLLKQLAQETVLSLLRGVKFDLINNIEVI